MQTGGLATAVAAVAQAHPTATIGVGAADEHRRGRRPVLRRLWAPQGQRPRPPVRRTDEWRDGYGFVRPRTGQRWWCLLPTVTTPAMPLALATFARDEGSAAQHRAVLVLDPAGWPIAHALVVPDGIDLVLLPAQSPEWPPAERLWALLDEPIANRAFADLDALEAVLGALPHPGGRSPTPPCPYPLPLVATRAAPESHTVITRIPYYGTLLTAVMMGHRRREKGLVCVRSAALAPVATLLGSPARREFGPPTCRRRGPTIVLSTFQQSTDKR